ncbi:MAG: hypothetical protein K0M45_05600 [Candidatus Paracaedibacteraceae bacterium]|nr:hypothetical protein [Candidatus Paracaedibacteraceae bacterium]
MKILNLEWLSIEAREAILDVSTNTYVFKVFCHPCLYEIGEEFNELLYCEGSGEIYTVAPEETETIEMNKNDEGCKIVATVQDPLKGIVQLDSVQMQLPFSLDKDIKVGDKVIFYPSRIYL